jgi:integrase
VAHVRQVQRKAGIAYECRWKAGGKERQRTFTVRRDAERFALKVENEIAEGSSTDSLVRTSKSYREVAEASMAASAKNLKASTASGYGTGYRVHIYPVFGTRRISTITSLEVEQWLAGMQAKLSERTGRPLTPATVRGTMIALSKVFTYALKHRLIAVNPCDAVDMPKKASAAPMFLEAWQVEKLATELDRFAPYGLMARFAAYSGLRAGELAALRIRDINFLRKHVEVRRTVQRANGGGWQFGTPKTARSSCDVPLRRELLDDMRAYLEAHPRRNEPGAALWPGRVQGGHGESKSALDFDRQLDIGSLYKHYFLPASKKVGLTGLKWHSLRHTYASLMAGAGIDIYKVSRWMGHSNVSVTDGVYTHLFATDHSVDMERLDAFLASEPVTRGEVQLSV